MPRGFFNQEIEPGGGDAPSERIDERRIPLVLPPHDFALQREGNALRPFVVERGKVISSGALSSATKYLIYWVETMDLTSRAGTDAGFARAVVVCSPIARTYIERAAIYGDLLTDSKFSSGYFMCVGADDEGERSDYIIASLQNLAILNGAIPGPVTDLQVSESGEPANGTVLSVLGFTYISPTINGDAFVGIQPVINDYPNLGDQTEFTPLLYSGPPYRGAGGGILRIAPARRFDPDPAATIAIAGTAVTGTGTKFTQYAKADDQIEVFNTRRRIATVNSDTSITLTASWPADPAVSAVAEFTILGKCRVYAVALSQTFNHSFDVSTWPFVDVDIDGVLSAPNAPATLDLQNFGNGIRGQFVQVAGTGIRGYIINKSTGTTDDITTSTQIGKEIPHDPTTPNGGTVLQFEDSDFTTYERENGQVFRYYVRTINVRGDISAAYATDTETCRLDSGKDGGDPIGKLGLKNLLYNANCCGTIANTVLANDTSQDAFMFTDASNLPGRPYAAAAGQAFGTGRYIGHTRLESSTSGAAALPFHSNGSEIHYPFPGNTKVSYVYEEVDAWNTGSGVPRSAKVKKGGVYTVSCYLKREGGDQPNGTFGIYIDQYNGGVFLIEAPRRFRDSGTDEYDWLTGAAAHYDVSGADLTLDWQRFTYVVKLDIDPALTVKQVRLNWAWFNGTQGGIVMCQRMFNEGEEAGVWTEDMGDSYIGRPNNPAEPPGGIGDGPGDRMPYFIQEA